MLESKRSETCCSPVNPALGLALWTPSHAVNSLSTSSGLSHTENVGAGQTWPLTRMGQEGYKGNPERFRWDRDLQEDPEPVEGRGVRVNQGRLPGGGVCLR